jgi:hypothetical protein
MPSKKNIRVWNVKHVEAKGTADDPSTPYGKLFKAGRLMYMWVNVGHRYMGLGIIETPRRIKPKNTDIIVLDGREYFVRRVGTLEGLQDVYVSALTDKSQVAKDMTLSEFETFLTKMRVEKGWVVTLDFPSVWCVAVSHKETQKVLGVAGSTSLVALAHFMQTIPIEEWDK